jgi:hypothetical protein
MYTSSFLPIFTPLDHAPGRTFLALVFSLRTYLHIDVRSLAMFLRYFPTDPLQYTPHTTPKLGPEPFLWHASLDETMNALGCRNVAQTVVDVFLHNWNETVDL